MLSNAWAAQGLWAVMLTPYRSQGLHPTTPKQPMGTLHNPHSKVPAGFPCGLSYDLAFSKDNYLRWMDFLLVLRQKTNEYNSERLHNCSAPIMLHIICLLCPN